MKIEKLDQRVLTDLKIRLPIPATPENIPSILQVLKHYFDFATVLGGEKGETLTVYEGGVYHSKGAESFVRSQVHSMIEGGTKGFIAEIIDALKRTTMHDREEFDSDPYLKNFSNGFFNIRTGDFESHGEKPKYLSLKQYPHIYNKDAKCPNFDKFMQQIQPDEMWRERVLESLAYSFVRVRGQIKAIVFYGRTRTGKTTTVSILGKVLGSSNYSVQSLHNLLAENDRHYAKVKLAEVDANLAPELSRNKLADPDAFKSLTGGEKQSAREIYAQSIDFYSLAKQYFTANAFPLIENKDDIAFFGRFNLYPFDFQIPPEDRSNFWLEENITEDEISGILNILLTKAKQIFENRGRLLWEQGDEEVKHIWLTALNPVVEFLEQHIVEDADGSVSREELFQKWSAFRVENKLDLVSQIEFNRRIEMVFMAVKETTHDKNGESIASWRGIRWRY